MVSLIAMAAMMTDDSGQARERTCFQTGHEYSDRLNIRADVAIVYGIDKGMPARVESWRKRGYTVHLMTGVAWGEYQDYLYGRFDGVNHEDEAQRERDGKVIGHGGDVYYMSPGKNYGKFLCVGVQRALDAGVEAVHLEEPEFWVRGGYSEGFKREWKDYYHEEWQPPHTSPDAQWRASKLKYFLYRRALQQVFDYVQDWNKKNHRAVRCYVPTHSLLNYAHWQIVSPESSLARLNGCDGYIAQVWTGTSRTPNVYRGEKKERTFETAFLEYGAMQNLVRATGRRVWYLADPVEDEPSHDWGDYRRNWRATLTASLLQPEVWRYEVMPWPERVWSGTYPSEADPSKRVPIPEDYATELQVVFNALKDMDQKATSWTSGTQGLGVLVSDSLMFERGEPNGSDGDMGHFYGLAMPLLMRGMPVQPVQLENVVLPGYLKSTKVLLASYVGQKPLTPEVHTALAEWVRAGGVMVFVDDDSDPYNRVRDWWTDRYAAPREHLFEQLGLPKTASEGVHAVGRGKVVVLRQNPAALSRDPHGDETVIKAVQSAVRLKESGGLILRRGPYVVAGCPTNAPTEKPVQLKGRYLSLFVPHAVLTDPVLKPGDKRFLVDLSKKPGPVMMASGALSGIKTAGSRWSATIEGVVDTDGLVVLKRTVAPTRVTVDGKDVPIDYRDGLAWVRFRMNARPQAIMVE